MNARKRISTKQREMLIAFKNDGEAADLYDFDSAGTLGWRNRERVIDALHRSGLLDNNGITAAGLAAIDEQQP